MSRIGAYVFTVVGIGKHCRRVEYSYARLRTLSKLEIIILAAKNRHDVDKKIQVTEVDIPSDLNDHEASIWLKTSLDTLLPDGKVYAYLDSDMLAVYEPDDIFKEFRSPIIFANDRAVLDQFSPYAMECGCLLDKLQKQEALAFQIDQFSNYGNVSLSRDILTKKQSELAAVMRNKNSLTKIKRYLSFNLARRYYHISEEYFFDKEQSAWYDSEGHVILYHEPNEHIQRNSAFTFDKKTGKWYDDLGEDIHDVRCNHLQLAIKEEFDINCTGEEPIWNGGLFLFDQGSSAFLQRWHKLIKVLRSKENWAARDQAALFIAAKEFNISPATYHLEACWNTIVAAHKDIMQLQSEKVKPRFVHFLNLEVETAEGQQRISTLMDSFNEF